MSNIFKALASISVWILFIIGVGTFVDVSARFVTGQAEVYPFNDFMYAVFGSVSVFLAVVAIRIRKTLD
ncbi:MAG: hypothetical protein HY671_13985 [Chloroflexi bacterium]|nr:hypothetical protein [Chloroflexota bacterium]